MGLSHVQLIQLIQKVTVQHPEVKEMLELSLPEPDLQPMEEQLLYLKKNIFKSLPNSRLSSKTDAAAFNKSSVHLNAFKVRNTFTDCNQTWCKILNSMFVLPQKAIVDNGRLLVGSGSWHSVVEYTFMAWTYVKATPVWDNAQHNAIRKQCFKTLSANCFQALRNNDLLDSEARSQIKQKLERLRCDCEDLELSITYLNSTIANETDD